MSAKRTGQSCQPPQNSERAERRLDSYGGQEQRQGEAGDVAEILKSLSVRSDERPSPHGALTSGEQPRRSQIRMHSRTSPLTNRSREQSSSRTGAIPRPQPTTRTLTTPFNAHTTQAASKPTGKGTRNKAAGNIGGVEKGAVRKGGPKTCKFSSTTDAMRATRASRHRPNRCRLLILIHSRNNREIEWSLFIYSDDADNVHMKIILAHDGEYHYSETQGLPSVDPVGLVSQTLVTVVEDTPENLVRVVRRMVPMPPHDHPYAKRLWVETALNHLVDHHLIDVDVGAVMANAGPITLV